MKSQEKKLIACNRVIKWWDKEVREVTGLIFAGDFLGISATPEGLQKQV